MKKQVLILEPYYGGSHKQFLLGLQKSINADFTFLTLPARKWKMRMQLSAYWFVNCIDKLKQQKFDAVYCSTFIDVAVLKALLTKNKRWEQACPICLYFHENQFMYPKRQYDKSQYQFAAINFNSAAVADKLAFNSEFNWRSFYENSSKYLDALTDIDVSAVLDQIERKKRILYPGVTDDFPIQSSRERNAIPVICWNHRWEHDKDPESFFEALLQAEVKGYDFKIVVLGQSFREVPAVFGEAQKHFHHKFVHFGYVESRTEYLHLLKKCDIVVSTSTHEFFGYSVIEAVRQGCIPLVPDRLSYPELYPPEYRYSGNSLSDALCKYLEKWGEMRNLECSFNTDKFTWKNVQSQYYDWLFT